MLPGGLAARARGQELREPDRLVLAEPQCIPVEQRQLPVQLQSRQRVGRGDAAHDDDVRFRRQLLQAFAQDLEERSAAARFLHIVEHEHERRRQTRRASSRKKLRANVGNPRRYSGVSLGIGVR